MRPLFLACKQPSLAVSTMAFSMCAYGGREFSGVLSSFYKDTSPIEIRPCSDDLI